MRQRLQEVAERLGDPVHQNAPLEKVEALHEWRDSIFAQHYQLSARPQRCVSAVSFSSNTINKSETNHLTSLAC